MHCALPRSLSVVQNIARKCEEDGAVALQLAEPAGSAAAARIMGVFMSRYLQLGIASVSKLSAKFLVPRCPIFLQVSSAAWTRCRMPDESHNVNTVQQVKTQYNITNAMEFAF